MDSKICMFTNDRIEKEAEPGLRYDHLSPEVLQGIRNAFQLFDKDGDGRITAEELSSVIDSLLIPQTATREDVERMIHLADSDGNGTVEFEEFFRIMHNFMAEQDPDSEVTEAFHLFDLDRNGFIDREELKKMMVRLGEALSDDDVDAMMRSADLNADGRIDFYEFKCIVNQRSREQSVSSHVSQASCSSNVFESSGSTSPQLGVSAGTPYVEPKSQRPALNGGMSFDSTVPDMEGLKRRRSSKQLTKSSSTNDTKKLSKSHSSVDTTRPSDLLTVTANGEKPRERPRRPSWTALRNLLKK